MPGSTGGGRPPFPPCDHRRCGTENRGRSFIRTREGVNRKPWSLVLAAALVGRSWAGRSSRTGAPRRRRRRRQPDVPPGMATAAFAGGCFWCMEPPFEKLPGVLSRHVSGYTGGDTVNPTYEQVSSGGTGHAEAVLVVYDPRKVTYEQLLEVVWPTSIRPSQNRQFCDVGEQYRTAIFVPRRGAAEGGPGLEGGAREVEAVQQPIVTPDRRRRRRSIRPRSTTRTTTTRTTCGTAPTARAAGATRGCASSGEPRLRTELSSVAFRDEGDGGRVRKMLALALASSAAVTVAAAAAKEWRAGGRPRDPREDAGAAARAGARPPGAGRAAGARGAADGRAAAAADVRAPAARAGGRRAARDPGGPHRPAGPLPAVPGADRDDARQRAPALPARPAGGGGQGVLPAGRDARGPRVLHRQRRPHARRAPRPALGRARRGRSRRRPPGAGPPSRPPGAAPRPARAHARPALRDPVRPAVRGGAGRGRTAPAGGGGRGGGRGSRLRGLPAQPAARLPVERLRVGRRRLGVGLVPQPERADRLVRDLRRRALRREDVDEPVA